MDVSMGAMFDGLYDNAVLVPDRKDVLRIYYSGRGLTKRRK